MMKILFISPYVPSLIRVRPYHFIRHLSTHGHQIDLVTLWSTEDEKRDLVDIQQYCHSVYSYELVKWQSYFNCLAAIPTKDPLQSVYCWAPEAARQIRQLLLKSDYDVVHIEHLRGAKYGLASINGNQKKTIPPIVWDSVDSISHLFRQASNKSKAAFSRLMTTFELGRTEAFESKLLHTFDHVLVTSTTDKKAFLNLTGSSKMGERITVLNNGVDLGYFCPDQLMNRDHNTLVVSGKLSYHANINMVLFLVNDIMPHVWQENPDTQLIIVGKDPPSEIRDLVDKPQIKVTGTVADIRPFLRQATAAVTPIVYGAGIQNKVLESMACGTPVVSTSLAVSALKVVPGKDLLVEDQPQKFAAAINGLLRDRGLQQRLSTAGRDYVEKYHNWDRITSDLEVVYNKVVHRKHELLNV
jgi:polysaccharide biosynthesis protein PslH